MKLRRTQELKCRSLMKSIALAYAGHGIASGCRRRRRSHPAHLGKCVLACLDGALITSHWRDRWSCLCADESVGIPNACLHPIPVPTANLKRLTAAANRLILAPDERSLQVDLVDKKHGQEGRAPNAIELHPMLSVAFHN